MQKKREGKFIILFASWRFFLGLALLTALAVLFMVFEYRRERGRVLDSVYSKFYERYVGLDYALTTTTVNVDLMRSWAEHYLTTPEIDCSPVIENLRYDSEGDYFEMPREGEASGSLFGVGEPSGRGAAFYRELHLAQELIPLMRAAQKRSTVVLHSYFFSNRHLSSTYPYLPIEALLKNAPGANLEQAFGLFYEPHTGLYDDPSRQAYWTDIYLDRTGHGLMVTRAAPVYQSDQHIGLIAEDITLGFLNRYVERIGGPPGRLIVSTQEGKILVDSENKDIDSTGIPTLEETLPDELRSAAGSILTGSMDEVVSLEGYYVVSKSLSAAPWSYIHILSEQDIASYLSLTTVTIGIVAFVLTSFLILAYFVIRQRKAERIQLLAERNYREVFNATHDPIFVHDAQSGKILDVNQAMLDTYGYTREEALELTIEDLSSGVPPYTQREAQGHIHLAVTGGPKLIEWLAKKKSGEQFWAEVALKCCEIGGQARVLAVVRDIDRRKQNEAELERYRSELEKLIEERTSELESAQEQLMRKERLAALGKLTATMGHELRNPLSTISNSFFTIGERLQGQDPAIDRAVERAQRNIHRCNRIIEDLLDFTRIQNLELEMTVVDSWLEELIVDQGISPRINLELRLHSGVQILLDRERFRRGIINLLNNAVQAIEAREPSQTEGRIIVESATLEDRVEIRIIDNGCGIPEQNLDIIFEPLFSTKNYGVGLGLPYTKQVLEQHGGDLDIDSQVGRGTVATVWLPVRK